MIINDEDPIIPDSPLTPAADEPSSQPLQQYKRRTRWGLVLTFLGFALFIMGARPSVYGLDRSPVIGFVQIAVFLGGIALISIGAYIVMHALWEDVQAGLLFSIGMRFVQTGYVITLFTGLADVLGLGSHPLPKPFFGPLQSTGVQIGEFVIGLGIVMMFPFERVFPGKMKRFAKKPPEDSNQEHQ